MRGIAFNLHRTARRIDEQHNLRRIDGSELVAEEAPQPDERRVALSLAFSKLRATHQSVLRMHYLEQTSAREVAALLGLTPKAVEGRLYQARKALRAELDGAQTKKNQEVRG